VVAKPRAHDVLLGAAPGQAQVQALVARPGGQEGVGEQVGALLARQATGVEDVEAPGGEHARIAMGRREPLEVDAAVPAPDARGRDPEAA
jgi:hypothetical protein